MRGCRSRLLGPSRPFRWLVTLGCCCACSFDSAGLGVGATLGETGGVDASTSDSQYGPSTTAETADATSGDDTDVTIGPPSGSSSGSTSTPVDATSDGTGTDPGSSTGTTGPEPTSPWCDPAWPDLAACYRFDDLAGGVLVDGSAVGNDGTVQGVGIGPGPLGESASFSADAQVSVPAHAATDFSGNATFEMWLRIDEVPASGRVGVLDRDGQYSLFLYADGGLRCGGGGSVTYWNPVVTQTWVHVGCVLDTDVVRLYIDAELVNEAAYDGSLSTGNGNPLAIGDNSPGFDEPLVGAIGGLRLWSVARTQAELCDGAGEACS